MSDLDKIRNLYKHNNGKPALKPLRKPCHDCAVEWGLYKCYAEDLSKLPQEEIEYNSLRWFCHNNPNRVCMGNIEYQKAGR